MADKKHDIWQVEYDIRKVNGEKYPKEKEMVRAYEEQVPRLLKEGAEKLADRFDFALVAVRAKSVNTGKSYNYVHRTDGGFADEWQSGRQ